MGLQMTEWYFQLLDQNLSSAHTSIDDDTGVVNVLTAGSPAEVTIYSDKNGTAAANPLAFTDGRIQFWTAASVTAVDLVVLAASGRSLFMRSVSPSTHRLVIDTNRADQLLVVPWLFNAGGTEVDTGFDLPAGCLINPYQLGLRVTTVDATETIDFGILAAEAGGDANGFIAAASIATAGMVNLIPQITGGINIDFVSTNYVGALLATSIPGADAVATVGGWTPITSYRTDGTAKSLSYTPSTSDTGAGYFLLGYRIIM